MNTKPKIIVRVALLSCIILTVNCYGQVKYGFLKRGIKPFTIQDIRDPKNRFFSSSDSIILDTGIYFVLSVTDSSKFMIEVIDDSLSTIKAYVDSSFIIQFDLLRKEEKRKRISDVFDKHLRRWAKHNGEDINEQDNLVFYERTYNAMRQEFVDYWIKNKDEKLLEKYFEILNCCTGDDGMDSRTVGSLYCLAPDEFCLVLNRQKNEIKDYIIYRLMTGIGYHIANSLPNNGQSEEMEADLKTKLLAKTKKQK